MPQRTLIAALTLSLSLALTGCIKPYQIPIEQGNIIAPEAAAKIHTGMTPNQVTATLGQPIMTNLYNKDLIYVYTLLTSSQPIVKQKLVITFRNNQAINIERG